MQALDDRSGETLKHPCDLQKQVAMLQTICSALMELLIEPDDPG